MSYNNIDNILIFGNTLLMRYCIFRSLNGSRDSEVCLRIEDTEFDDNCRMNKQMFKSGKFAGSLRRRLMREHLGVYKEYHFNIQLAKVNFV